MAAVTRHLRPEPGVTEIRIHGVGGTTPEGLLEQTGVQQVTGDDKAGLYRGAVGHPGRTVEAYSWGGLTARSRSRAFWVVLLPFSLINLAGWMVEPPRTPADSAGGVHGTLVRTGGTKWHEVFVQFIAISTTAMYVMWAALISMNTLAFQCGAIPQCRGDRWYLDVFETAFFIDHPGRRVVAALLVPIGLLALFVVLGQITRSRYDDYGVGRRSQISQPDHLAGSVLGMPEFWYPSRWQRQIARVHIAAVLLLLGGLLGRASSEFEAHFEVDVVPNLGYALFWVCAGTGVALLIGLGLATLRSGPLLEATGRGFSVLTWAALAVAAVMLAVAAWLTWRLDVADSRLIDSAPGEASKASTDLWGFGWAPILLLAMAAAFVGLFSAVQLWRWFVSRLFFFDQFVVVLMLAFIVLWQWAPWVGLLAGIAAVCSQWLPDMLVRFVRSVPVASTGPAVWRLAVFLGVCLVGFLARQWTTEAGGPFGVGWPRLTPVLLFTAILVGLGLAQTSRVSMNNPDGRKPWPARVALVAVPSGVIGVGLLLSEWFGRTEWFHGAAWLAWMLTAIVWLAQFQFDGFDRWRWNGPAAVAVLALAILVGTFSGLLIWLVDLLDRDGTVFVLRATAIYQWMAVGFAAMLIAVVVGMATWYGLIRLGMGPARDGSSIRAGEALPEAVRAVDVVVTMGSLLLVWALVALVVHLDERYATSFQSWIDDGPPGTWKGVAQAASWVALGVAAGAFLAVRRGLQDHAFRTRFGALWDVASFWPRSFHPFAPPAYAMRAVPELQARLTEIADSGGTAIVSAHSQGSVVSIAAVASLRPDVRRRVRLITHGSPLARFYKRFFPRYFPDTLFERCARTLAGSGQIADGAWLNYWRPTDPIGDPVFGARERDRPPNHPSAAVLAALDLSDSNARTLPDVRLADPITREVNPFAQRPTGRGHSGYMADPAMWRAIDALTTELTGLPADAHSGCADPDPPNPRESDT